MIDIDINPELAARVRAGEPPARAELEALDGADVLSLGMLADEVRRARVGREVRFVRVLRIGGPIEPVAAASLAGCHEVRLTAPGESLAATLERVREARALAGATRLTGFSLSDLHARGWASLTTVASELRGAGLDALAEATVDEVSAEQLAAVVAAGLPVATLAVRSATGHGRVDLVLAARALVEACPAMVAFAPLARQQPVTAPTTGYHDVRMVALARLALPTVPTIGVDWEQFGPKLAQVALTFGANLLDGVPPVDDETLGRRRATVEELRRNIRSAGFEPVEAGAPA